MPRTQTQICNGALDALPAGNIASIDDTDDVGALACKRQYQNVFEDLLGEHDYDAAIRRAALAETTNDRPGEWRYCYAMPASVASVRRVLPDFSASYLGSAFVLLEGQQIWTGIGFFPQNAGVRFVIAGNLIYCDMPSAVLEYVTYDATLAYFRPLFYRAFELELAARICMPVIKNDKREAKLITAAEVARNRAMADDLNNSPTRSFDFMSENAMVRVGGMAPEAAGYGLIG